MTKEDGRSKDMNLEIKEIEKVWPRVRNVFAVPHSLEEYNHLVSLLDEVIDQVEEDESHPMASLMETLGSLVEVYESENVPEMGSDAAETLKYLMDEHGLKQSDLAELGSQGVVSEILTGKRALNIRQVKALSKYFNVSPAVFIS